MKNKIWLKIFSVLFAVLAWTYVNLQSTLLIERTITVPVNFIHEPANIRVLQPETKTTIKLSGTRKDFMFAKYTKRLAQASIDLKEIKPGSYQMPIDIINVYPGLKVVSYKPNVYKIDAEEVIKKQMPLTIQVEGDPEDDYVAGEPTVKPETVTLRGDAKDISMIEACVVKANISKIKNSFNQNLPINQIYKNGYISQNGNISIEPPNAQVTISIKYLLPTKTVAVAKPTFIDEDSDKKIVSWEVTPKEVGISGPKKRISAINEVKIRPISIKDIGESKVIPVVLETLPPAINFVGSPTVLLQVNLSETNENLPDTETNKQPTASSDLSNLDLPNPKDTENGN